MTNGSPKQTKEQEETVIEYVWLDCMPDGTIDADSILRGCSSIMKRFGRYAGGRMLEKFGYTNPAFLDNAAYIHVRSLTKKEYSA